MTGGTIHEAGCDSHVPFGPEGTDHVRFPDRNGLPGVMAGLDGMVDVITGGASGIGLATAHAMASSGAQVIVLDTDVDKAAAAIAALEGARASVLDVSRAEDVDQFFDLLEKVDILVNSAGIARRHAAIDHPLEDWDRVVAVNMTGIFLCARAAARCMLRRGNSGAIVNVASIMGLSGGGLYPNVSYHTTKGAVVNMTRALAVEWAPHGIRVNAVAPTFVETPFIAPLLADTGIVARIKAKTPLGRLANPAEIASAIQFLASPAAAMITGHILPVDGGYLAQ